MKKVQTIEQTSKEWKACMALGVLMLLISSGTGAVAITTDGNAIPHIIVWTMGLLIYLGARIMAWWYHG